MENEKNHKKAKMLITLPLELRQKFKMLCSQKKISMNLGVVSLMETVTVKKKYKLQHRWLESQPE